MDWFDKEFFFERRTRKAADLWRYIPYKKRPGISRAYADLDGYWIELEAGWTAYDGGEDCSIIHEYTVKDLCNAIKTIRTSSTGSETTKSYMREHKAE